jgi:hypothetical protein
VRLVLVPSFAAWLVVVGCGGARPASTPAAPASSVPVASSGARVEPAPAARPPAPAVTSEPPPWTYPPRSLRRRLNAIDVDDPPASGNPARALRGLEAAGRKSDYWSPCVRAFVQSQPAAARELLGDALSLYSAACSTTRVEFRVPRIRRSTRAQSHLGLVGALERTSRELSLRAVYHGEPLGAERITLIADGVRWSSPRIDFEADAGGEVATLPFTRTLAGVVRRAIDARDALLRFEGATRYEDIALSDDLKQELQMMLDALDARDLAEPADPNGRLDPSSSP